MGIGARAGTPLPLLIPQIPFNAIYTLLTVLAVLVTIMVAGILLFALLRARREGGEGVPRQNFGNRNLELTWTVIPALVILGIFIFMFVDLQRGPTPGAGIPTGQQPDIQVIGHQWWWEIRYPKAGGVVTANEIHIPVGQQMLVSLNSFDVQHDFWVPQLGQKMDMYPNKTNFIWLKADNPGVYLGACAEYCGTQHAWMRIRAVAQTQADYNAWLSQLQVAPQPAANTPAAQGRQLFSQYACGSCHMIAGTEFNGNAAPALTNFSTRQTISAGVLDNTPENLARYLRNPQAVKPGVLMPNFRLSEPEVQALVAYLESLK